MLSSNTLKYVRSLRQKKFRQKYNNFVAEGEKIVGELLDQERLVVERIFGLSSWIETNPKVKSLTHTQFTTVNDKELGQLSALRAPNKVLAIVRNPDIVPLDNIKPGRWSLYLDDIRDPGNMGTILRIADWFGWKDVFCSPTCVDVFNEKVVQSTMGAFLRVNIHRYALDQIVNAFPNQSLFAADLNGEDIFKVKAPEGGILIIGNESHGISPSLKQFDLRPIRIPGSTGGAESLNAGVAAGICCAVLNQL